MSAPFHPERDDLARVPDLEKVLLTEDTKMAECSRHVRDLVDSLLFRKMSQLVALLLVLVCLQGCNIMHRPSFDDESGFQDAPEPVHPGDEESRKRDMRRLLEDPQGSANRALLSGISSEQRDRIMEHFTPLFHRVRLTDFVGFLQTCSEAREKLGIMNFDRYEPQVLREALRNFNEPEYQREKPALIVIIARPDESTIGGVQPLNVESYQVGRLLAGHKLFLFECGSAAEVLFQVRQLIDRRLITPGKLRGLVIGSHGTARTTEAGVTSDNLPALLGLTEYFDPHQADLVFANCYSGEDGEKGNNLVNRALLLFSERFRGRLVVNGCDGLLAGVDFDLNPSGSLEDGTLRLQSLASTLTLGILDNTYTAQDRNTVYAAQIESLRTRCDAAVPNDILRRCVTLGLCDPILIGMLHRKQITPERYVEFVQDLGQRGITFSYFLTLACLEKNLSLELIERYVQSVGYNKMSSIVAVEEFEFFELGITDGLVTLYRAQLGSISREYIIALCRKGIMPWDLQRLKANNLEFQTYALVEALTSTPAVTIDQLISFARLGMKDLYTIQRLVRSDVSENLYGNFCLLGVSSEYSILEYVKKDVTLETLRSLRGIGFDVSNAFAIVDILVTRRIPLELCLAYGRAGIRSTHDMTYLIEQNVPPIRVASGLAAGMTIYEIAIGSRTVAERPR